MDTHKTLSQKKLSFSVTLQFADDYLLRRVADPTGEHEFKVDYEDSDFEGRSVFAANMGKRYYRPVSLFALAGLILLSSHQQEPSYLVDGAVVALVMAAAFVIADRLGLSVLRHTFSPINGKPQVIRVKLLHDKQPGNILQMLKGHKLAVLRRRYATVDHTNDPDEELSTFRWLMANEVISESEFNTAQRQLEEVDGAPVQAHGGPIKPMGPH